jgi:hypothetical protein
MSDRIVQGSATNSRLRLLDNRLQNCLTGTSNLMYAIYWRQNQNWNFGLHWIAPMSVTFLPLDNSLGGAAARRHFSGNDGAGLTQREGRQISEMVWRLCLMLSRHVLAPL